MKIVLALIILLMTSSITKTEKEIECIDVYYIESGIHYTVSMSCKSLYSVNPHYAKIKRKAFLDEFEKEFKKLKKTENNKMIDTRISVIVHYKDKFQSDTLCFSEYKGISLNFQKMTHNPKLLKLITDEINYYKK